MQDQLLTAKAVMTTLGVSRSTLWRWCRDSEFPSPISLGTRRIAWRAAEVQAWIDSRPVVGEA
ncbi:AlpA family phage regulatory protein [uncultured Pseudomonas sp.]|uniref:helix-turn-helix transcriptional regulator n=1 Tax=uncultured Pseudomonas sp. TaxID=114707 RepID=UPI00338E522E